jgi:hypothetical protein
MVYDRAMADTRPGAGEPIVTTVLSWVLAVVAAGGWPLMLAMMRSGGGMENLGLAVLGLLGMAATFAGSGLGAIVGGIGVLRARQRGLTSRPLLIAVGLNLAIFIAFVLFIGFAGPSSATR